ncbi:Crp/Fnr family transcriptional regulator [Palleronia sp. KMU-117]|uniref:Crp/Fnr family transcriptional regulator n=1 Tax=Palleronia sp. KMU-117 TaxID=3434108 RepID=UPI003D725739
MDDDWVPETGLLIGALTPDQRDALDARGQTRRFHAGQTIFCRGEPGEHFFVILEGDVEISVTSSQGRRSVLNHMGPGEVLGEIAFLDRGTRSADAVATTDVVLSAIDRRALAGFLNDNPDALLDLMAALCAKVRNASEMAEGYALSSAPARLARCLIHMGRKWGQPDDNGDLVLSRSFSQGDLGQLAGIARENVNRHFRAWEKAGLVAMDRGIITLRDPESLAEIAEL